MKSLFARIAVLSVYLVLLCPAGPCQSPCAEEQRQAAAVGAVRTQTHSDLVLKAALLPTLTDHVISLETKRLANSRGTELHIVSFYRIIPSSYQLEGNKVVGEIVELDNYREWLVAISHHNDEIYLLEGSTDPIAEFNRLAKDLHLQVTDADGALDIFDFFLKVARGEQFRSHVISDEMKLESVALEDFRLRYPIIKRKAAFNSWWAGLSEKTKHEFVPPKAGPVQNGFNVEYFFYSQGKISRQNLTITGNGTVVEGKPNVLISANVGSAP